MARILVLDDEPDTLLELGRGLEAAGHVTVLAADGDRALECLETGGVDLVVVDVSMVLPDGWRVLDVVSARTEPLPVVAIGEPGVLGEPRLSAAGGVVARVAKPGPVGEILAAVDAALRRGGLAGPG